MKKASESQYRVEVHIQQQCKMLFVPHQKGGNLVEKIHISRNKAINHSSTNIKKNKLFIIQRSLSVHDNHYLRMMMPRPTRFFLLSRTTD
jgi:hypothetical protein